MPSQPDLGLPASYLVLERGEPVFSSDGKKVGTVAEVRADYDTDVFDGLVVSLGPLGLERRYVKGEQVEEVYERGVMLAIDSEAVQALPVPGEAG